MDRGVLIAGSVVVGGLVLYYLLRRAKAVPTPPPPTPAPTCYVESVRIYASKEVVTEGEQFTITYEVFIAGEPPEEGADLVLTLFVSDRVARVDRLKVTKPGVVVYSRPITIYLEGTYIIYAEAKIEGTDIVKKSNEIMIKVTRPPEVPPVPPAPPPPRPPIIPKHQLW